MFFETNACPAFKGSAISSEGPRNLIFTSVWIEASPFSGSHDGPDHWAARGVDLGRLLAFLEARYELLWAEEEHQGRRREVEDEVEPHVVEEEKPENHFSAGGWQLQLGQEQTRAKTASDSQSRLKRVHLKNKDKLKRSLVYIFQRGVGWFNLIKFTS